MRVNRDFVRIATAKPMVKVADCFYNATQITEIIHKAAEQKVSLVLFPELTLTSVSCGDLISDHLLLKNAELALAKILEDTKNSSSLFILGLPILVENIILNVAVVCLKGCILNVIPKYDSNSANLFIGKANNYWFIDHKLCNQEIEISNTKRIETNDFSFSINFWNDNKIDTSDLEVAEINLYLSGAADNIGYYTELKQVLEGASKISKSAILYCAPGFGESTTDVVHSGAGLIYELGTLLNENKRFTTEPTLTIADIDLAVIKAEKRMQKKNSISKNNEYIDYDAIEINLPNRKLNTTPFLSQNKDLDYLDAFHIQAMGLAQRLTHIHCYKVVIGISGGLDSTLTLLACVRTFDILNISRKNIIGITMPGFGTSGRTYHNAQIMMERLGISSREISIKESCIQHFKDINHNGKTHDVTYENAQARERTQILMDVANMENALVIGTGDLSELALGWATYNGDHMSMYDLNASIPKTLVQDMTLWAANKETDLSLKQALMDVLATPISPELKPTDSKGEIDQKTENLVGPYELHDFFLYNMMKYRFSPSQIFDRAFIAFDGKYNKEIIKHWLKQFYKRFFMQQFKRSCSPDGPNVTGISLSPRGSWTMPSDASSTLWLAEIEQL